MKDNNITVKLRNVRLSFPALFEEVVAELPVRPHRSPEAPGGGGVHDATKGEELLEDAARNNRKRLA